MGGQIVRNKIIFSVPLMILSVVGCGFYNDAGQTIAMGKHFAEEGRISEEEGRKIRQDASNVTVNDGITEEEAEALVKDYLLDKYPHFLGWSVMVTNHGEKWKTISHFVGQDEIIYIDKKTAALMDSEFKIDFLREEDSSQKATVRK